MNILILVLFIVLLPRGETSKMKATLLLNISLKTRIFYICLFGQKLHKNSANNSLSVAENLQVYDCFCSKTLIPGHNIIGIIL